LDGLRSEKHFFHDFASHDFATVFLGKIMKSKIMNSVSCRVSI